jgi:hypothetical protein
MVRGLAVLLILCVVAGAVFAQKTVHVREYRRKDGTVVKAHNRRAPKTADSSNVGVAPEVSRKDSLEKLAQIEFIEPCETVDLGGGSFYTPGGTGVMRPRRTVTYAH